MERKFRARFGAFHRLRTTDSRKAYQLAKPQPLLPRFIMIWSQSNVVPRLMGGARGAKGTAFQAAARIGLVQNYADFCSWFSRNRAAARGPLWGAL